MLAAVLASLRGCGLQGAQPGGVAHGAGVPPAVAWAQSRSGPLAALTASVVAGPACPPASALPCPETSLGVRSTGGSLAAAASSSSPSAAPSGASCAAWGSRRSHWSCCCCCCVAGPSAACARPGAPPARGCSPAVAARASLGSPLATPKAATVGRPAAESPRATSRLRGWSQQLRPPAGRSALGGLESALGRPRRVPVGPPAAAAVAVAPQWQSPLAPPPGVARWEPVGASCSPRRLPRCAVCCCLPAAGTACPLAARSNTLRPGDRSGRSSRSAQSPRGCTRAPGGPASRSGDTGWPASSRTVSRGASCAAAMSKTSARPLYHSARPSPAAVAAPAAPACQEVAGSRAPRGARGEGPAETVWSSCRVRQASQPTPTERSTAATSSGSPQRARTGRCGIMPWLSAVAARRRA